MKLNEANELKCGFELICERASFPYTPPIDDDNVSLADCVQLYREYKKAEEQGLLVKLPYKVGDSVHFVGDKVYPFIVSEFKFNKYGADIGLDYYGSEIMLQNWSIRTSLDNVGKRIFTTKEEAEAALERMKHGEID